MRSFTSMDIKYLTVKTSKLNKSISNYDGSLIEAIVYGYGNPKNLNTLERLSIFFEQSLLCKYLLEATPNDKKLISYNSNISLNFKRFFKEYFNTDNKKYDFSVKYQCKEKYISIIYSYIVENKYNTLELIDTLKHLSHRKDLNYTTYIENFYVPYFSQSLHTRIYNSDDQYNTYSNAILLVPSYKQSLNDPKKIVVTFNPTTFTNHTKRSINISPFKDNKLYSYISNLNFTNKPWQSIVDIIQSFNLDNNKSSIESFNNLPGILQKYFYRVYIPGNISLQRYKKMFIDLLTYIFKHNQLNTTDIKIEELSRMMSVLFADDRFNYLTLSNPTVAAKESWLKYLELREFTKYGMEAQQDDASSDESESQSDDDTTDDTTSDTDTPADDDTSADDTDTDDDDTLGDDDDFAMDDGTDDDASSDGTSSDETDTTEAEPEDVNPLIEIIDNESFDEFLERGLIERHLKRIFDNPPPVLSTDQLNLLVYWYNQWFPLVSIETTKLILKDILSGISED